MDEEADGLTCADFVASSCGSGLLRDEVVKLTIIESVDEGASG